MLEIIFLGFLTTVAFILVMFKMGIGRFVRLGWVSDVAISMIMAMIFVGTFTGMATGLVAGIFLSIFLTVCRWFAPTSKKGK